jgi:hypothetical protein
VLREEELLWHKLARFFDSQEERASSASGYVNAEGGRNRDVDGGSGDQSLAQARATLAE